MTLIAKQIDSDFLRTIWHLLNVEILPFMPIAEFCAGLKG